MPDTTLGVEAAGERIVIQRHRTPMAALVPLPSNPAQWC